MSKILAVEGRERGSPEMGKAEKMTLGEMIQALSGQMQTEADRIAALTNQISVFRDRGEDEMIELFDEIRVGHLESLQKIILHLTKLVESDYPMDIASSNRTPEGVSAEVDNAAEIN